MNKKEQIKIYNYFKNKYLNKGKFYWYKWIFQHIIYSMFIKYRDNIDQEHCDVLLLQPSVKAIENNRKKYLINSLEKRGIVVLEVAQPKPKEINKKKLVHGEAKGIRTLWIYELYANYIKYKYCPKVIITERNNSQLLCFLKSQKKNDPKTFHLAHSALVDDPLSYDVCYFDYYCLYGQSSYEALANLTVKLGSPRIVFGGSYLFNCRFIPHKNSLKLPILLLGLGPSLEKTKAGRHLYSIILQWQKKNKEKLLVRLHPRSSGCFFKNNPQKNITVLPDNETIIDSVLKSSIVISGRSNAIIDAALLGRPVQLILTQDIKDCFSVEKFFTKCAKNHNELNGSINKLKMNFNYYVQQCPRFTSYHLEKKQDSVEFIAETIEKLL